MGRFIKRLKIKLLKKVKGVLNPSRQDFTDSEIKSAAICRKLINHKDSIFLIAPLSNKRYIKNEPLGMFVVLVENRINITNHIYNYDIMVPTAMSDKLCQMFDNKVEHARLEFEKEMHGQIQHSLSTILSKLS